MSNEQIVLDKPYWIAFSFFEGIGPLRFKLLHDYFGSAKAAWEAPRQELEKIGLGQKITDKFCQFRAEIDPSKIFALENNLFLKNNYPLKNIYAGILDQKRKEQLQWVTKYHRYFTNRTEKIVALTWQDKEYPERLKTIESAPPVIYLKTNSKFKILNPKKTKKIQNSNDQNNSVSDLWHQLSIAVVGSRRISNYGRQVTEKLVSQLVSTGFTIISGMARGTDSLAHETAIKSGGKTIAVLGCGVDIAYPPENEKLYQQIDLVVSEFPPGMPPLPGNFPARNRIVAGLSDAVLVTEAAQKSGSLITPRIAGEQGKEVFAIPGPITSPLSEGTAWLIKQGAKLVYSIDDILSELKPCVNYSVRSHRIVDVKKEIINKLSPEEMTIFETINQEPLQTDDIIAKIGFEPAKVNSLLTIMKLKGIVKEFGNGFWGI